MNGKLAKKVRRELKQSQVKIATKAVQDFKMFVRSLPFRARLALAYKIIRGILCLVLLFNTRPALAEPPHYVELDTLQAKIIQAESSGDPKAIGDHGRARGLMQINAATWRRFSRYPWDDAFDEEKNYQVGRAILEHIAEVYGDRATTANVAYTYNVGRYCFGPLPSWTQHHPNKIYREIFNQ